MRAVLFDTETTGLSARTDRIVEIAALELINDLPSGRYFHCLIDPGIPIPAEVVKIHGITDRVVRGKPKFEDVVHQVLRFFGDGPLIAHNAQFDFGFLDAELGRLGRPPLDRSRMHCTMLMAREKWPGMPASLDALCNRLEIDTSGREKHNALLDCRLLAQVYVELRGGRQQNIDLFDAPPPPVVYAAPETPRVPRLIVPTEAELAAHAAFLKQIKSPLWNSV